jgi:hypothetical protein
MTGSVIEERAAVQCSCRIRSTVAWNSGSHPATGVSGVKAEPLAHGKVGDADEDAPLLPGRGLPSGDCEPLLSSERPNIPLGRGVAYPDIVCGAFGGLRRRASDAARRRRFVVPRALVDPERAEQTTATLFESI